MFDWITQAVEQTGYLGVALLMFAENLFPPIPSELIMPLAGFTAQQGQLNIVIVVVAGSIGSLAGAILWYYVGAWLSIERIKGWSRRYGRWITLSPREIDEADAWFDRHGGKAVFIGRLVPAVRTLISVPAGLSCMAFGKFLIYSTAGTVVWTALLASAGYLLGDQYQKVQGWLNPVSNVIIAAIVLYYLYRVATFQKD